MSVELHAELSFVFILAWLDQTHLLHHLLQVCVVDWLLYQELHL